MECECIEYIGAWSSVDRDYPWVNHKFAVLYGRHPGYNNTNTYSKEKEKWVSCITSRTPSEFARGRVETNPGLFRLADCNQCKHKITCLMNSEAMVVFESV